MGPQLRKRPKSESELQDSVADPFAVTWIEKYSDSLDRIWKRLPSFLGSFIATVAIFILGSTIRGDWLLVLVHFIKYLKHGEHQQNSAESLEEYFSTFSLEQYHLQGLQYYILGSAIVSYTTYLGIGGFLHWYFYIRQRDRAEEWKCQPKKWLSPELERHEILLGSLSLVFGSIISGILSCYVMNGGWSKIYYDFDGYGWTWWFLQWPVIFIYQDYLAYVFHRLYHTPWLYKHFHKLHHTYKQPTAFSVTALHPFEFVHVQMVLISPMFLFPCHWVPLCTILLYIYYHGIIDHSGINFKAQFWQPWQPDCIFHDNHHQYFHVNFGFNCGFWDKIHGTYRRKDRIYREDIYYGFGKDITEASKDEVMEDKDERLSENPLAYRGETHQFLPEQ